LGPNGAGKSTTINVICTLLTHDAGRILVDGHLVGEEDEAIREKIGIVFQDGVLDPLLTVRENLVSRASLYGNDRQKQKTAVENAIKATDLAEIANRRYGKLSGGQRRRADIARALVNYPSILFLDEPTTGLDPQTRKNIWETIMLLQEQHGMTVFLTTHYMEEAAKADYVIVIDNGMIAAKGTPMELKDKYSTDTLQIKPIDKAKVKAILDAKGVKYAEVADLIIIDLDDTMGSLPILKWLEGEIKSLQVLNGTMDDAFIRITGKEMR
jgi:multidrug/hemolysin transport system ATP-binding protein